MFKLGIMGMTVPREYGGAGADQVSAAIVTEELAKACASTSDIVAGHTLCCVPILEHGTEEQKRKYLPMLTKGGVLGGMASPSRTPAPTLQVSDGGPSGGRPLCHQRRQDLHYQRPRGRRIRDLRHD